MKIAILGLGYVGIQLAVGFGEKYDTVGFDYSERRLDDYRAGVDPAGELAPRRLAAASRLRFTSDERDMADCAVFIVAVPTPVDEAGRPDFGPLDSASRAIGRVMRAGSIVVYESTVYPGATEEVCLPILEECSGLRWKRDFNIAYSPERINPGDGEHTLRRIVKVVSADTGETLDAVAALYGSIIDAGVHRASSIRVAEAAKVIENTQRDLNIALINELAVIFERMDLSTRDVLEVAGTKWNFLNFRPGLVGGHCIGVDPYYLTYKAQALGYHPEVILAGRRINDGMGKFIAEKTVKKMLGGGCGIGGARVNVYGFTFKENCADIRNTQVIEIVRELKSYGIEVSITDAMADFDAARREYGETLVEFDAMPACDAVVVAVAHDRYVQAGVEAFTGRLKRPGVLIDIKSLFTAAEVTARGFGYWSL